MVAYFAITISTSFVILYFISLSKCLHFINLYCGHAVRKYLAEMHRRQIDSEES